MQFHFQTLSSHTQFDPAFEYLSEIFRNNIAQINSGSYSNAQWHSFVSLYFINQSWAIIFGNRAIERPTQVQTLHSSAYKLQCKNEFKKNNIVTSFVFKCWNKKYVLVKFWNKIYVKINSVLIV